MRIFTLFLLSIILLSISVNAQQYNKKVAIYYEYKHKAENAIMDSNYHQAIHFYQKAFRQKSPFPTDLNNAFIVSYMIQDTTLAQEYYNMFVLHGWKKKYMEGDRQFFGKIVNQSFYIYLSRNYDSLWNIAIHSEMPNRAKELDSIAAIDRAARENGENMIDKSYVEQMLKGDTKAIALFLQFIRKHGFPNFNQAGLFEDLGSHPFSMGTAFIIFWHQRGQNMILNNFFKNAVMNGDFIADQYAITIDQAKEKYYSVLPKFKNLNSKQIKSKLAVINKERAKIYLESIEDYSKKLAFQKKHPQFYFVNFFTYCFNASAKPVSPERSAELNKKFHVPKKTKKHNSSKVHKQ